MIHNKKSQGARNYHHPQNPRQRIDHSQSNQSDTFQHHTDQFGSQNILTQIKYQSQYNKKLTKIGIILTLIFAICVPVLIHLSLPDIQNIQSHGLQNLCLDRTHNSKYFNNLLQYLSHNKIRTILNVNYDGQSKLQHIENAGDELEIEYTKGFKAEQQQQDNSNEMKYDWIIVQGIKSFNQNFLSRNIPIKKYAHFGITIREKDLKYNTSTFEKQMESYFKNHDFIYDETKSLSLRRPQNKIIYIFIKKNTSEASTSKFTLLNKPDRNFLSISTVIKMRQNIPYLREWFGYHIHVGVDKFFIYDNSNSSKYFYDPIVTKTKNRYGMDIRCVNLTDDEVNNEWKSIWEQFYDHIVYINWEPKDQNGNIIYGQVQAQEDYVKYFRNVVQYTSFTDTDQMIFSQKNYDIKQYILGKAKQNVTILVLYQRHFECRFCVKKSKMIDIVKFFREKDGIWWAPKVIAQTKYFVPYDSIHNGKTSVGERLRPPPQELRFNHYNFEKFNLAMARARNFSPTTKFEVDQSMLRYKKVIQQICHGEKCSQNFELQCPKELEYTNCLNASQQYPFDAKLNIPQNFIDGRPLKPNGQPQIPEYKPVPPPKQSKITQIGDDISQILRKQYKCQKIFKITDQNVASNSQFQIFTTTNLTKQLMQKYDKKQLKIQQLETSSSFNCVVIAEPQMRSSFLYYSSFGKFFILKNQRSQLQNNLLLFLRAKKFESIITMQHKELLKGKFLLVIKSQVT